MRIQPSSYINDAAPVRNAAITNHLANVSGLADDAGAVCGVGAGSVFLRTINQTNKAKATFINPAVSMVPGRPTARISTKPLIKTPIAAPRLFVKYRVARVSPG